MEKPIITVDVKGPDGNVFALLSKAHNAIIGQVANSSTRFSKSAAERTRDANNAHFVAQTMADKVMHSHSYEEAVAIIEEYVIIEQKGGGL